MAANDFLKVLPKSFLQYATFVDPPLASPEGLSDVEHFVKVASATTL